jgi:hypothetical protein
MKTIISSFIKYLLYSLIISLCSCFNSTQDIKEKERNFANNLIVSDTLEVKFPINDMQYYDGYLYVYDNSDKKLKKLDNNGGVLKTYGRMGQGPGEFNMMVAWEIDSLIKIADSENLRISYLNKDDSLIQYFNLKKAFVRAVHLSKSKYLLKTFDSKGNQVAEMVDFEKGESKYIETPIPKTNDGGFASDGLFVKLPNGNNLHISFWLSNFFCFDRDMNILYQGNTIDRTSQAPKIVEGSLPKGVKPANFWASANSKYFYVLSGIRTQGITEQMFNDNRIVDVYSIQDGSYSHSYYLPNYKGRKAEVICVSEKGIYAMQGEFILYFKFE